MTIEGNKEEKKNDEISKNDEIFISKVYINNDLYNKTPKILKVQDHFNIDEIEKFESSTKKKFDSGQESETRIFPKIFIFIF